MQGLNRLRLTPIVAVIVLVATLRVLSMLTCAEASCFHLLSLAEISGYYSRRSSFLSVGLFLLEISVYAPEFYTIQYFLYLTCRVN